MKKYVFLGCLLSVYASILLAATPAELEQANREAERILREQQIRQQQDIQDEIKRRPKSQIETETVIPSSSKGDQEDTTCREVKQIVIEGSTLISAKDQEKLVAPYVNTCMKLRDIELLLGQVTAYYVNKGYIGARVYIQPQQLNQGLLKLLAVEGQVEKLMLEDGGKKSINLDTAFPRLEGKVLNLRDIEQGLDQVNRLLSNSAKMQIKPGEQAGGTVVVITNDPSRRVRGGLSFDNTGSSSTGESQGSLNFSLDNPLSLNDTLNLSHRRTTAYDSSTQHARADSLMYSIPYGPFTVTLNSSWSEYASEFTSGAGNTFVSSGKSKNTSLGLDYVAYRDVRDRININGTLTRKNNENYLNDVFLSTSSRTLSLFELMANWSHIIEGGSVSANLSHTWGLDIMGALKDANNLPNSAPRAQYEKWNIGGMFSKSFPIGSQSLAFSSQFSAQYGVDVLYGTEQFFIGSPFNVRGFRNTSLSGDRGYYLRNDLGLPLFAQIGQQTLMFKPYIGYDFGDIKNRLDAQGGRLSGFTTGLMISNKYFNFDAFASRPVSLPDRLENEGTQAFVRVSVNF